MTTLNVNTIKPAGATLTLGESGDSVVFADDVKVNLVKDAGGNTLWSSNGSGVISSVKAGIGGADKLLSTQTASSSASISFTTGIDSTYKEYVFVFINIHPSANDASFTFNASTDGGSNYDAVKTTTLFSAQHNEAGGGAALFYDGSRDIAQGTGFQIIDYKVDGASSDGTASGSLHLFNPGSTTYVKNFYSRSQYMYYDVTNTYSISSFVGGYYNTTSEVDGIRFQMDSGNIDAGTIKMYGIAS